MTTIVKSYHARVNFLLGKEAYTSALSRLPQHRRQKAQSFYFSKDRALCVGAWMLLEHAMAVEGVDISRTQPLENAQGKPHIAGAPDFNLSHSGMSVMCSVSVSDADTSDAAGAARAGEARGLVGCDVQLVEPWDDALARTCMQPWELDEMRSLADIDPEAAAHAFFRRWTIKESYMKARGLGFMLPPDTFAVDLGGPGSPAKPGNPRVIADVPCKAVEFDAVDDCCFAACSLDPQAQFEPMKLIRL